MKVDIHQHGTEFTIVVVDEDGVTFEAKSTVDPMYLTTTLLCWGIQS